MNKKELETKLAALEYDIRGLKSDLNQASQKTPPPAETPSQPTQAPPDPTPGPIPEGSISKKIVAREVRDRCNRMINAYMACILGMFMILALGLLSNLAATLAAMICMIAIAFQIRGLIMEVKRLEATYKLDKAVSWADRFSRT